MCTDFFGKEQLFLILEFEFGGSDLESMNKKVCAGCISIKMLVPLKVFIYFRLRLLSKAYIVIMDVNVLAVLGF